MQAAEDEDEAEAGSGLAEDPWGLSPTIAGLQSNKDKQSTLNPLDPWALGPISGDHKGSKTTTQSTKSTLDPLAPWNLGPLVGGIKGPDVNVRPGQSTLSPLLPWNLGPKASTLNPLDPWSLGGPEGTKGPELGLLPGQSTLSPLSPWNLGPFGGGIKGPKSTNAPEKSTINPLAPWNLGPLGGGVKGPEVITGPGQSTLSPLLPWNIGPKASTINPLDPWNLTPGGRKPEFGVDPSQSTLNPLLPWNIGPVGGGAKETTVKPPSTWDLVPVGGGVKIPEPTPTQEKTTQSPLAPGLVDGVKGSKPTEKSSVDPFDIFGINQEESTLPQSTRAPLAPWDLGAPGEVAPGQSTLNPLSPWNLGPKATTLNPLDPWILGPVESGVIKTPGKISPTSQSTMNPLSPWNIDPISGAAKGGETTQKPGQGAEEDLFEHISKIPSKSSESSEAPWGTGIITTSPSECTATTRAPCQALTSPALSRCSGLLDPGPYQAACERELCAGAEDPQEVVCQWAGEFASQCLEEGLCVEWRRALACPVTSCQENEHFEECGPGCDLDCQQSSCSSDGTAPACYCDTHMVGGDFVQRTFL